jgi:hypothetical protein
MGAQLGCGAAGAAGCGRWGRWQLGRTHVSPAALEWAGFGRSRKQAVAELTRPPARGRARARAEYGGRGEQPVFLSRSQPNPEAARARVPTRPLAAPPCAHRTTRPLFRPRCSRSRRPARCPQPPARIAAWRRRKRRSPGHPRQCTRRPLGQARGPPPPQRGAAASRDGRPAAVPARGARPAGLLPAVRVLQHRRRVRRHRHRPQRQGGCADCGGGPV